jgi:hypothetical protein
VPTTEAPPRLLSAGLEAWEKGPSLVKKVVSEGAARRRSPSSGCCASIRSSSRAIVGRSSPRNVGSRRKPSRSAWLRLAVIAAVLPASRTHLVTSVRRFVSSPTTVSESRMKFSITRFWLPSTCSTRVVSRRPG